MRRRKARRMGNFQRANYTALTPGPRAYSGKVLLHVDVKTGQVLVCRWPPGEKHRRG